MDFNKKALHNGNINQYVAESYPHYSVIGTESFSIEQYEFLLQKNYGGKLDCTLTSITSIFHHLLKDESVQSIYDLVEKTYKNYGYNADKHGSNPIFAKRVINTLLEHYGLKDCKSQHLYIKGIGFNYEDLIEISKQGIPFMMNINKDGRNYYTNHSVTLIGYKQYIMRKEGTDAKIKKMITTADNWHDKPCYIDYDKLGICSINFIER